MNKPPKSEAASKSIEVNRTEDPKKSIDAAQDVKKSIESDKPQSS